MSFGRSTCHKIAFMRVSKALIAAAVVVGLAGCDGFFTKDTPVPGGGTHVLYATSSPSGANGTVQGFTVSSTGGLSSNGASATVSVTPKAIAITPNNQFLYVANQTGVINAFAISGSGITAVPNTPSVNVGNPVAMVINNAGTLLFALNLNLGAPAISAFRIQSDGELAPTTVQALPAANVNATDIGITPTGNFLYVAGGNDTAIFGVTTDAQGNPTYSQVTCSASCTIASQAVALHPNGAALYVADGTSQIAAYSLNSSGVPTLLTTITGLASPNSLAVDSTGNFLLATTSGDSSLNSFAILQNGSISKVASVKTGTTPVQVRVDPGSNTAFTANSSGSPDISGFTISSSGRLTAAGTASVGGNASALAVTH